MNLFIKRVASEYKKLLLVFACIAFAVTTLSAQNNRVKLSKQEITIAEAFREIEKQTGCNVAVNLGRFDVTRRLKLHTIDGTVDDILAQLLAGTGYTHKISGNYIMIVPPDSEPLVAAAPQQPNTGYANPQQKEEFERKIEDYTAQNLAAPQAGTSSKTVVSYETVMQYDTIVHTAPHDGVFQYTSQSRKPYYLGRRSQTRSPFMMDTPPLIAIKTNLLYAATLTPNIAVEIGLGNKYTLEISGGNNPWNKKGSADNNKKMVHWMVKPEFRYWLCERFNGHYFGVHAFYSKYNVGGRTIPLLFDKEFRYQGDAIGGGVSYGYHWMWNKHWGMEFNIGVGVAALDYVKKDCEKCGREVGNFKETYFGPTSAGIKLIYVIK